MGTYIEFSWKAVFGFRMVMCIKMTEIIKYILTLIAKIVFLSSVLPFSNSQTYPL